MLFGYSFAKVQKKRIITIFLIFATLTKKACFIYKIPTVAHRYEVPDHPDFVPMAVTGGYFHTSCHQTRWGCTKTPDDFKSIK